MTWQLAARHTIIDCPEFLWRLDEYRDDDKQMMLMHLTVHKWSKDLFKRMKSLWTTFRQVVTCPLYALNPDEDEKWAAFVGYFGFKPFTEITCNNGERRTLFLNEINNENRQEKAPHVVGGSPHVQISEGA